MGEREGIDYCFVSKSTFMEKKDIFLKREENPSVLVKKKYIKGEYVNE